MKTLLTSASLALVLASGLAYGQAINDRKDESSSIREAPSPKGELQKQKPISENSQAGSPGRANTVSEQEPNKIPDAKNAERRNKAEEQGTPASKAASESRTTADKSAAQPEEKSKNTNRVETQKPSEKGEMKAQRSGNTPNENGQSAKEARESGSVSIDSQKQTRIQDSLRNQHAENITHADFDVRVGVSVPDRYRFNPLPEEVVSIVPEYRGYDYIMVNNEIVILEPQTHKIVYTMQEGRSAAMDRRSVDCK